MKRSMITLLSFAFAGALAAQQPKVSETQFKAEPVERSLAATVERVRKGEPVYSAEQVRADLGLDD